MWGLLSETMNHTFYPKYLSMIISQYIYLLNWILNLLWNSLQIFHHWENLGRKMCQYGNIKIVSLRECLLYFNLFALSAWKLVSASNTSRSPKYIAMTFSRRFSRQTHIFSFMITNQLTKFFRLGEWVDVLIDDQLPTSRRNYKNILIRSFYIT